MGFGLGIIDSSGRLIGDNRHQRVGLACLSDARQIFHGAATPRPLTHNDIDGLEHYDVMKPIEDAAGAVIGHLLASYRLGLFDAWLDRLYPQTAQQLIELRDGSGQVLSSRGRPPASDDTLVLGSSVPGTQLGLRMTVARPAPPPIYAELQWISAAAKLLTLAVFCGAWLALRRFPACAADAPIADLE